MLPLRVPVPVPVPVLVLVLPLRVLVSQPALPLREPPQ